MSQKYEKLKMLLKELFQLDQPDLDFGLYRIMHAKSAEVSQFLDKALLPQVKTAFNQYRSADKVEIEKDLATAIEQAQGLGVDPETTQRVKELRARLKSDAVDIGALESEVYDHLFSFFRRYYSRGRLPRQARLQTGCLRHPLRGGGGHAPLGATTRTSTTSRPASTCRDYAFLPDARRRKEADARSLPACGRRRGRARQRQGGRGQEARVRSGTAGRLG